MAKATGFLDYKRQELDERPAGKRIKDWHEIKTSSIPKKAKLQEQAARCMDCGVPFCHSGTMIGGAVSGCPLHNLMPEFNDFVYQGLDQFAYARLNKTNNFPEFTSHVCPAPCEGACCAGVVAEPVTVRNIEQYIIEKAFAEGWVQPNTPETRTKKKVAVIGSGPAGLACADELNKLGHTVTVYERDDRPGGLLMYGIPNMKLDKELILRRVELLKKAGVKFELNSEVGKNVSSNTLTKEFDAVVLCTGSTIPRDLPVTGRNLDGIYYAKDYLHKATKSLLDSKFKDKKAISAKDKNVVVIGGGDTGTDCVATAIRQGCKSVKQLEIMPCLPHSRTDSNPWPEFPRVFKTDYGQEEAFHLYKEDPREYCIMTKGFTGTKGKVSKISICQVTWEKQRGGGMIPVEIPGTAKEITADLVLLAMGFVGTEKQLFDEFKFTSTPQGNIAADETTYATTAPGIFTAGDARRGQSLVVWAIKEGRNAALAVNEYLISKK